MEEKAVPPGATAEEVADNIDAKVSLHEYIIPANVVRYIGLKHIQKMVDDAKEALGDDSEQVEGGEPPMEEEDFPFDPSELEFDEEDDNVPHMAEGGYIDNEFFSDYQNGGYTGVKEFKDAEGNVRYVPYVNGKPLFKPPAGYTESAPASASKTKEASTQLDPQRGGLAPAPLSTKDTADNVKFVEQNKSPLAGDPKDWGVQDFIDYQQNVGSAGDNAMKGLISMMPLGKAAMWARDKYLDHSTAELMDQMLETGMDLQGNPIPEDQKIMLSQTRQNMINQMGEQSGLNLGPFDKIADAVKSVMNFTSGGDTVGAPRSSVSPEAEKMLSSSASPGYTYSGGNAQLGSAMPSSSDDQYSGTSMGGAANADGTSSQSAVDNASSGTGGLYSKGGFITRRKKMC